LAQAAELGRCSLIGWRTDFGKKKIDQCVIRFTLGGERSCQAHPPVTIR
jgi:hypothetical protein